MGMLAGFVKGATGEYTKQRDEERTNEFQSIRDKRISELRKGEQKHATGLLTEENIRKEDVLAGATKTEAEALVKSQKADRKSREDIETSKSKFRNVPAGGGVFDTEIGKGVYNQPHKPTAGSSANLVFEKSSVRRAGSGVRMKTTDLYDEWYKQAYTRESDEITGMTIWNRNKDIENWPEYHNSMVHPDDRMKPNDIKSLAGDPDALYKHAQENVPNFKAREAEFEAKLKEAYPWWSGPAKLEPAPSTTPEPEADLTPAASTTDRSKTAGLITQGARGGGGSRGFAPQQTQEETFGRGINLKIRELEGRLTALQGKRGRSADHERRLINDKIAKWRGLVGGG